MAKLRVEFSFDAEGPEARIDAFSAFLENGGPINELEQLIELLSIAGVDVSNLEIGSRETSTGDLMHRL